MTRRSPTPSAIAHRAAALVTPGDRIRDTSSRRLITNWSLRKLLIAAVVGVHGSTAALVAAADPAGSAQARSAWDASTNVGTASMSGNPVAQVPLARLSATRDRPLFSPSRRPPFPRDPPAMTRAEQQAAPLPLIQPPSVILFGIVVGVQGARAFIAAGPADRIIGVRRGDDVDGWKVTAITQRRLVLSRADLSSAFTLFSPENASRTARSEFAQRPPDPPRRNVRIR
jgi:general secretion pathway protein N